MVVCHRSRKDIVAWSVAFGLMCSVGVLGLCGGDSAANIPAGAPLVARIDVLRKSECRCAVKGVSTDLLLGEVFELSGTSPSTGGSRVVLWEWDLDGDGQIEARTPRVDGSSVSSSPGFRQVTLVITDETGRRAVTELTFRVLPYTYDGWRLIQDTENGALIGGLVLLVMGTLIGLFSWHVTGFPMP